MTISTRSGKMKIAVIGAGMAGIVTAKHFVEDAANYEVTVFEQAADLGGIWKYPDGCEEYRDVPPSSPFYSRMYRNLRKNTPRCLMEFSGFPFESTDPGGPSFVTQKDVLDYLRSYAIHFGVVPHIKFRHRVKEIRPLNDEDENENVGRRFTRWSVTVEDLESGDEQTCIYDSVIICNGHYHKPHWPTNIPGLKTFTGSLIHSSSYRVPDEFQDKKVLIIGGRSSANDIALHIAPYSQKVIISRHESKEILRHAHDNILETGDVGMITPHGVVLENGVSHDIDSIILCTGYEYHIPFLHPDCHLEVSRGRVFPLYHHMISCYHPSLAFMAIYTVAILNPILEFQIRYYKAVLEGRVRLPSSEEMIADAIQDFEERKQAGQQEHHAHKMEARLWPYVDRLAAEMKVPSYRPVLRKIYETMGKILYGKPQELRKYKVRIIDDENFEYFIDASDNQSNS